MNEKKIYWNRIDAIQYMKIEKSLKMYRVHLNISVCHLYLGCKFNTISMVLFDISHRIHVYLLLFFYISGMLNTMPNQIFNEHRIESHNEIRNCIKLAHRPDSCDWMITNRIYLFDSNTINISTLWCIYPFTNNANS